MLINALSCSNDYVSDCLQWSQVVHKRGKRNQTQIPCHIYFSGKGQTVAKVVTNWLSHNLSMTNLWTVHSPAMIIVPILSWGCSTICSNSLWDFPPNGKSPPGLPSDGLNASGAESFLLPCSTFASILLPSCFLLCGWIASSCWCLTITCQIAICALWSLIIRCISSELIHVLAHLWSLIIG